MREPLYRYGDLVLHQGATMKIIGSYFKLDQWHYDMYCQTDGCIYDSVDRYIILKKELI